MTSDNVSRRLFLGGSAAAAALASMLEPSDFAGRPSPSTTSIPWSSRYVWSSWTCSLLTSDSSSQFWISSIVR